MTRKIRIGLRIKFNDRFGVREFIRETLNPWNNRMEAIIPFDLINGYGNRADVYFYSIDFPNDDISDPPHFSIKEIFYEKKI